MTKIEQVAAAMALATNGGKWDDGHYCEDHKALWMKRARAAVEAMREPTKEMERAAVQRCENSFEAEFAWGVMIDAALQEKPDV